jgi:hypothetical protein
MRVDRQTLAARVRADFVVRRLGRRFVAEVKSGALAPDPCHPPTRRQLLEYCLAFGSSGLLLVDMGREAIRIVEFPALVGPRLLRTGALVLALVALLMLGLWWRGLLAPSLLPSP